MLPSFFKQNQLVKSIKESRKILRFEYPSLHPAGTPEEQAAFVQTLNNTMIGTSLNRVIALIRFQNFDLFKVLVDLIKKMDIYKLKFVITYMGTYLEEFLLLCDKKAQLDPKLANFKDEFDPDMQERKKDIYEIDISNQIFQLKVG